MFGSSDDRWLVLAHWSWRAVLFATLVVLILGLEQLSQAWMMSDAATALAVRQFEPSDGVAEALRTLQWAHNALPVVAWGLIGIVGWATFVPLPRCWVRWLKRTFA